MFVLRERSKFRLRPFLFAMVFFRSCISMIFIGNKVFEMDGGCYMESFLFYIIALIFTLGGIGLTYWGVTIIYKVIYEHKHDWN